MFKNIPADYHKYFLTATELSTNFEEVVNNLLMKESIKTTNQQYEEIVKLLYLAYHSCQIEKNANLSQ